MTENDYRQQQLKQELTSVGLAYIHTCRSYVHMPRDFMNGASPSWCLRRHISMVMFTCGWEWARADRLIRFWASGGTKFTKMGDSLLWTQTNHRAKFDAASFILGREIRNRTKKTKKQTKTRTHLVWIIMSNNNEQYITSMLQTLYTTYSMSVQYLNSQTTAPTPRCRWMNCTIHRWWSSISQLCYTVSHLSCVKSVGA